MSNSIETAIAIAFFGTIAIDIAIAKAIFQLLLLILLREFSKYCCCYVTLFTKSECTYFQSRTTSKVFTNQLPLCCSCTTCISS